MEKGKTFGKPATKIIGRIHFSFSPSICCCCWRCAADDVVGAAVAADAVVDNVVVADNVKSSQLNFQTLAACGATKTFPKRENETERVCVWVCVCVYVCRGMSVCVKMYLCEGGCELACVRAREREKK